MFELVLQHHLANILWSLPQSMSFDITTILFRWSSLFIFCHAVIIFRLCPLTDEIMLWFRWQMLWKFGHLLFCPFGAHLICWLLHVALKTQTSVIWCKILLGYLNVNSFVILYVIFIFVWSDPSWSHKCWSAIKFHFFFTYTNSCCTIYNYKSLLQWTF